MSSFTDNVSKGFNRVIKVFSYRDPFDRNLYYLRYKKNGQEFIGSFNGKDGSDAAREFMRNNPGCRVVAYRRFSMHLGLAENWKSFGGS